MDKTERQGQRPREMGAERQRQSQPASGDRDGDEESGRNKRPKIWRRTSPLIESIRVHPCAMPAYDCAEITCKHHHVSHPSDVST